MRDCAGFPDHRSPGPPAAADLDLPPATRLRLAPECDGGPIERFLAQRPGVSGVEISGSVVDVSGEVEGDALVHDLHAAGLAVLAMEPRPPDLEQIFLRLTS